MKTELYPVIGPQAIFEIWPLINEGVHKVLKYSHDETSVARSFNELMNGTQLLWICRDENGEYLGYCITSIETVPWEAVTNRLIPVVARTLVVVHAYLKPDSPRDAFFQAEAQLIKYANQMKCTEMRMFSERGGAFERILVPHGWDASYTVFIKKVAPTPEVKNGEG